MAELAIASAVISAVGAGVAAAGTIAAGNAAKEGAYFKAAQEDQAGQEGRAASQRGAMEKRRQAGLIESKIQAGAAASGAGASDPGIVKLTSDVAGRGEYQALTDMYTGENRARGLSDVAMGDRMSGDAAKTGSEYKATATLLSGAGSFADRYNKIYG